MAWWANVTRMLVAQESGEQLDDVDRIDGWLSAMFLCAVELLASGLSKDDVVEMFKTELTDLSVSYDGKTGQVSINAEWGDESVVVVLDRDMVAADPSDP